MDKYRQLIKLFVVLFFSTAFTFSFSHFGAKAYETLINADGKFSDGTTIGDLDVSGKTEQEAKTLLEEKYVDWLKTSSFQLQYGEQSASFDINQFHLDATQTVNSLKDGQTNTAFITVDKVKVEEQVEILFPQVKISDIDIDKLMNSLNSTASLFETGTNSYNLYNDYLLNDKLQKDVVINEATVEITDLPVDLQRVINEVSNIEIKGNFSLLNFAKVHEITDFDALNVIATGIYQAILPSNFTVIERNIGKSLPVFAKQGYEAKVDPSKNDDLVIANPNKTPYNLELHLSNNELKVKLKGQKFAYDYQISLKDQQELKAKTIIQYSPLIAPGITKIQTRGSAGKVVKVYRDIYQGSSFIKSELISEDYYPPVYQVEIHGLTGSQSAPNTTTGSTNDGTSTSNQATNNAAADQTISSSVQQDTTESAIWGKPNEQEK